MSEIIEEGKCYGAIEPITINQTEKILDQMKKSICKVQGKKDGTGFFCHISMKKRKIPVLMTNYHIIDDNMVKSNREVKLTLNENNTIFLKLKEENKIFSDIEYDIMILNIENNNNFEDILYLELDENLDKENPEKIYESIYILHYPNKNIYVSYGYGIKKLNINDIEHKCYTEFGSSGSPILNLSNNKVIGIHKAYADKTKLEDCYNLGTLLKYPLEKIKEKNGNEINKITKGLQSLGLNDINIVKEKFKKKYNNIIYYTENVQNLNELYKYSDIFEKNTPGTFILSTDLDSLKLLKDEIIFNSKKNKNVKFNLILGEFNIQNFNNFINQNSEFFNHIQNTWIFAQNLDRYSNIKNESLKLLDISNNYKDIIKFIDITSSEDIKQYSLSSTNIITYQNYLDKYKKFHYEISKFYGDLSFDTYIYYIRKIENLLKENPERGDVFKGFLSFDVKNNRYDIIREWTKDTISFYLNRSLANLDINSFDTVAYFTSRLMYSLNSYAQKENKFCKQKILYSGFRISYCSLLSFKRAIGKIVTFPYFISTCEDEYIADSFSQRKDSINLYKNYFLFSAKFILENNYKNNYIPNGINITDLSVYRGEKENLFLPFSFYYLKNVIINIKNYTADVYLETIGKTEILEEQIKREKEIKYDEINKIMKVNN